MSSSTPPLKLQTDVLVAKVRRAVSVSMMQTGEKWVDREGNPASIWTHDEYDEAMAALNELQRRARLSDV